MDFLSDGAGVEDGGHVGRDYGGDSGGVRAVDDATHHAGVGVVDYGVDGEVGLHSSCGAYGGDIFHVVGGEVCAGS